MAAPQDRQPPPSKPSWGQDSNRLRNPNDSARCNETGVSTATIAEREREGEDEEEDELDESQQSLQQQRQLQQEREQRLSDIMESIVKITGSGLGGTIIGLSLQQRLRQLRVTTPATVVAEARRKRFPPSSYAASTGHVSSSASQNLPLTWALACTTFVSIIEISRYVSPSTILMENLGGLLGRLVGPEAAKSPKETATTTQPSPRRPSPYMTTIVDYAFGGAVAGVASSFGQRRTRGNVRNSTSRGLVAATRGRPPVIGVLTGAGLGFVAGCVQAAVDYGVKLVESQRDHGM